MTDSPCKGCNYRVVGCHATCVSYGSWKAVQNAIRDKRIQELHTHQLVVDEMVRVHERIRKDSYRKR